MVTQGSAGSWQRRHWWTGNGTTDLLGFSVGTLESLNGDARDELVIAAPVYPDVAAARGKVYLVFGPPNDPALACTINGETVEGPAMEASHTFAIEGNVPGAWLGMSLATGDVDGNGLQDLLLGAPGSIVSDPAGYPGRAFLIRDGTLAQILADVAANGPQRNYTLSSFAGTPGLAGSVVTADAVINVAGVGLEVTDRFGMSVAFVGDLNGIAGEEFVIGAPEWRWDAGPSAFPVDRGYVQVHRWNAAAGTAPLLLSIAGTQDGEAFGWAVAGGVNINALDDAVPELLVGAPLYDVNPQDPPAEVDAGRVRVFSGFHVGAGSVLPLMSGFPTSDPNGTILYGHAGDRFGYAVTGSKSINGPNASNILTDDILIGAILHSPGSATACGTSQGGRQAGTVYAYDSGQSTPDPILELRGEGQRDRIGWSLVAGHVFGTLTGLAARADVVSGGLAWDQTGGAGDVGRVYVFEGASVLP